MLRMFRLRGKRIWFLIFAACATLLIFRWGRQTDEFFDYDFPLPDKKEQLYTPSKAKDLPSPAEKAENVVEELGSKSSSASHAAVKTPVAVSEETPAFTAPSLPNVPPVILPERMPPGIPERNRLVRPSEPKGRLEAPPLAATTTIHWQRQVEHFPVPTESIIHLPTGDPVPIPKIQFDFKDETPDEKINREKRQAKVKAEFQKAWKGYRDKAWMHDELSPVSGSYRDPFCGWAATLVDGLDTLWIMGFEREFEDAAKAVGQLDFTTSPRTDIPMFETTIRYLGGLIAAYDVSGKRYKVLLNKAIELADVLMGAFDTPNRMPVLYYHWAPAFASQPKRASTYSNTAELGSLSMEFTRLAQITQEPRYYDAVARITNALSEWQDRGTQLDGVFPDNIDASGCNRTEVSAPVAISYNNGPLGESAGGPQGYHLVENERQVGKPKSGGTLTVEDPEISEMKIIPGNPAKAKFVEADDKKKVDPASQFKKRQVTEEVISTNRTVEGNSTSESTAFSTVKNPQGRPEDIIVPSTTTESWDCKKQGLEAANPGWTQKFSMAGGQDSTYEYFPKQYLLLGGHEEKYSKLYLKTIKAVRKYMLYRPMVPGNRDILFSGSVERQPNPEADLILNPEVEHLTCFIGGMIGMSAKIFDLEGDLELAKKLTDGCVWAYESFPSGIMPEGSNVAVCKDNDNCEWDDKVYRLILDPMGESRDKLVEEYIENRKAVKLQEEAEEKARVAAAKLAAEKKTPASSAGDTVPAEDVPATNKTTLVEPSKPAEAPIGSAKLKKDEPISLQRRTVEEQIPEKRQSTGQQVEKAAQVVEELPEKSEARPNMDLKGATPEQRSETDAEKLKHAGDEVLEGSRPLLGISQSEKDYDEFVRVNEVASGREAEVPLPKSSPVIENTYPEPVLPQNHTQWVNARIKQERLPPGFTNIRSRTYILRPEAIESVWYMYRITGDKSWQDKGWKMFDAIIKATSAEYGNSAISDVTEAKPAKIDEMESFWLAETLKYFYLLYSTPDVISLDEWVLNTEAHPFKREVK